MDEEKIKEAILYLQDLKTQLGFACDETGEDDYFVAEEYADDIINILESKLSKQDE